jgi:hypothetical protein
MSMRKFRKELLEYGVVEDKRKYINYYPRDEKDCYAYWYWCKNENGEEEECLSIRVDEFTLRIVAVNEDVFKFVEEEEEELMLIEMSRFIKEYRDNNV